MDPVSRTGGGTFSSGGTRGEKKIDIACTRGAGDVAEVSPPSRSRGPVRKKKSVAVLGTFPQFRTRRFVTDPRGQVAPGVDTGKLSPDALPVSRRFGGLDDSTMLWTWPARLVSVDKNGVKVFDLGNGIMRYDRPDGSQMIVGLTVNGKAVSHERNGKSDWWYYDTDKLLPAIVEDAITKVKGKQEPASAGTFEIDGKGVAFKQFHAGKKGGQFSLLTFPDGRGIFQIFSARAVPESGLANIARVIQEAHPATYSHSPQIFIVESLGETREKGGDPHGVAGLALFDKGQIIMSMDHIDTLEKTRYVLDHETGHILDHWRGGAGRISSTAKDEAGNKIFGNPIVSYPSGEVNLSASGYISHYATRNALEDFAETHRYVLAMRRNFNAKNPRIDFFDLPPTALRVSLHRRNLPEPLQKKILAIVAMYREMAAKPRGGS